MVALSLILVAACVLMIAFVGGRNRGERVWEMIGLMGSLVATFCGVAWAIWFTNRGERQQEQQAVVALLLAARSDVGYTRERCAEFRDLGPNGKPYYRDEYVDHAPMPRSGTLDAVLQSELVLRHMSPATFKVITAQLGMIDATSAFAAVGGTTRDRREQAILTGAWYTVIWHALESEVEWQRGRATDRARDSMTRYWWTAEINRDSLPGTWRHFRYNESVRESLMQEGVNRRAQ